ncbi:MAG: hypothetical protein VB861_14165 [Planctomycetaceae bacterium]
MDVQGFMLAVSRSHGGLLVAVVGLVVMGFAQVGWLMKIEKRLNQLEAQQKPKDGGGE